MYAPLGARLQVHLRCRPRSRAELQTHTVLHQTHGTSSEETPTNMGLAR